LFQQLLHRFTQVFDAGVDCLFVGAGKIQAQSIRVLPVDVEWSPGTR